MQRAATISFILHFFVLIILYFGISDPFKTTIKDDKPMIIDFVAIGKQSMAPKLAPTNSKKTELPKPEKKEEKPIEEKIEEKPQPKEEKKEEKIAPPENDKKIEEKKPEVKKEEPKKVEKKPEPKEEKKPTPETDPLLKKKEPLKEKKKEAPKKKEQPKEKKQNDKALVNLKKNKDSSSKSDKKADSNAKTKTKTMDDLLKEISSEDNGNETEGAPAESIGPVLTATDIDALRQAIKKCWSVPIGLEDAENLIVEVDMKLDKEGNVTEAEIVDKARMKDDANFKIAAENAKRAVLDPKCHPLPLSPEKYNEWKELTFVFNPKDMFQ